MGRGPKEYIKDRLFLWGESWSLSQVVDKEFSLHIQLGMTEDKQVKTSIRSRMPRDNISRYGYGGTKILERIMILQGIPVIQVRLNFVEYFIQIYDRMELYKRLLAGESLGALYLYSHTSRGSTVNSGTTMVLVMASALLLSRA